MARARHLVSLALVGLGVIALVSTVPAGVGAAPESEVFSAPGSHSFVVPDGVTAVTVDAHGAEGGSSGVAPPVAGGLGGRSTATIPVTPGETLQINVGGKGGDYEGGGPGAGGTNGGGGGGGVGAGGGGGASDVRRGGTDLHDRVVVAGGGGAGGGDSACETALGGVGGGDTPTAGGSISGAAGGGAGGPASGGAGGAAASGGTNGQDGTAGQGGDGGSSMDSYAAGGGGGGWFGGGGGGGGMFRSAAGGGGSAHVVGSATAVSFENGTREGDGLVVLTWEPSAPTTTTTTTTTSPPTTTTAPSGAGPVASYGDDASGGRSSLTVAVGGELTIASQGWQPSSVVTVTMFSDPVELGTVRAGADGRFVATFSVPVGTQPGAHRVVVTGTGADGEAAEVVLSLEVDAASAGNVSPAEPRSLAFTC